MKESKCCLLLQISALVPEIFKFEKCVKYANEMADDVIHSTQYYFKYILNRVSAQIIETWQANSATGNTPVAIKVMLPWQLTLSSLPPTLFQYVSDFQFEKH